MFEISTFVEAQNSPPIIALTQTVVRTTGYAEAGDGGAAIFVRYPSEPAHGPKFQDTLTHWFGLGPAQDFYPEMFGAVGDGVTDDQPALQSALDSDLVNVLLLQGRTYAVASQLLVPSGKTLRGAGRGISVIRALEEYAPRTGSANRILACPHLADDVTISDLTVDGAKVGLGEGPNARLSLVCPAGRRFKVERVNALNGTGYAFYARGETSRSCSGSLTDLDARNCDVLFEATHADGVVFDRFVGGNGDGDIAIEAVIHPVSNASNISFRNGRFAGIAGSGANIQAIDAAQTGISLDNCDLTLASAPALFVGGNADNTVYLVNCRFRSGEGQGANIVRGSVYAAQCSFTGSVGIAVAAAGRMFGTGSAAMGAREAGNGQSAFGIFVDSGGAAIWHGGTVEAVGGGALHPVTGNVVLGIDTVVKPPVSSPQSISRPIQVTGAITSSGTATSAGMNAPFFALDGSAGFAFASGNTNLPSMVFDSQDRIEYIRSSDTMRLLIANTPRMAFSANGANIEGVLTIGNVQVMTSRRTGWGAPTGTATRSAFATASVTLPELAERVKALIDDLRTHGLIGN